MNGGEPRRLRVLWVGGEPTPTRVPHLQALAQRPEISLTVVYATRTYQQRTWSIEHPEAEFLHGWSLPTTRILHHDYPITPGIWRVLERGDYDLVVIAGWAVFAAQIAIVWCRLHGVPYLLNAENHFRERRPLWVRLVKRAVLRFVIPQAAGMLVSGTLAREHALAYGARPNRVIVFPNTPDVSRYAARADELRSGRGETRARLELDEDEVVVLQVGRLIPVKAADVLVEAVARAQQRTSSTLRLVLAGEGPERERLESLAAARGVRLVCVGQREDDDLIALYVASDVFALLSRRETWGIVVNEAMACGLPVVLSAAVGAAGDLLRAGENGAVVAPGDAEGAAAAIAALAGDPDRRRTAGRRSQEIVAPWGFERSLEEFGELATAVVGDNARRRGS